MKSTTMARYIINPCYIIIVIVILLFSCKQRPEIKESIADTLDTSYFTLTSKNIAYCIPSPHLSNLYLKKLGIYPDKSLINPITNIERYNTSEKKALNLGVYIIDLGYLNLFRQDENNEHYLSNINTLIRDLGLESIYTTETFKQINKLKNNPDSLSQFVASIIFKADSLLKSNAQHKTSVLLSVGAWIESFYLLCKTYEKDTSADLLTFIYQQKFILDNLIQVVRLYYRSSIEINTLLEYLIEIAYNFDVLDFHYSYANPAYTKENNKYIVKNKVVITGSSPALQKIIQLITELRTNVIF